MALSARRESPIEPNLKVVLVYLGNDVFLTPYVIYAEEGAIVVDPGPRSCLSQYYEWRRSTTVCTHIHLDHCGSAGDVVKSGGVVYAHANYLRHLVNPGRLWQKSLEVLGSYAELFGRPIEAEERGVLPLRDGDQVLGVLRAVYTPGHAPHHVMFYYEEPRILFVGDGGGVYFPDVKAVVPSTPPPLDLENYIRSLEKALGLNPSWICFAHAGCTNDVDMLRRGVDQLMMWVEEVRMGLERGEDLNALLDRLSRRDEMLERARASIRSDVRRMFVLNSILGVVEYVRRTGIQ